RPQLVQLALGQTTTCTTCADYDFVVTGFASVFFFVVFFLLVFFVFVDTLVSDFVLSVASAFVGAVASAFVAAGGCGAGAPAMATGVTSMVIASARPGAKRRMVLVIVSL